MKTTCRYSGVQFFAEFFPQLQSSQAVHPIFFLSKKDLLGLAKQWLGGSYDQKETRLYFLSLANSTGLLDWSAGCAARPSDKTIETNIQPLLEMVSWLSAGSLPASLVLPHFAVTVDSRDMENMYHWIAAVNEIKEDWKQNFRSSKLRAAMEAQEEQLYKLINSSSRSVESYAPRLIEWAIIATRQPNETGQNAKDQEDRWRKLFCLRGAAIYTADRLDLEDLYDYMLTNLDAYSSQVYAAAVFKHLRKLIYLNSVGIGASLGMAPDFELVDFEIPEQSRYSFLADEDTTTTNSNNSSTCEDVEEHNRKAAVQMAPSSQPFAHQYTSKIEFLKASARWRLAQAAQSQH